MLHDAPHNALPVRSMPVRPQVVKEVQRVDCRLRWRGGQRGNWRIAGCVVVAWWCGDYASGGRALMWTWWRWPGRLRPSSAAAVASLGAGRGLGPWLTAVDGRPRPRCARGFRSRMSSLHQVALGLCEGELGTWGDPRAKGGGTCASPHSKPLAGNPRARCGRSHVRSLAMARRITTRTRQCPKRCAAWSGLACSRAGRP